VRFNFRARETRAGRSSSRGRLLRGACLTAAAAAMLVVPSSALGANAVTTAVAAEPFNACLNGPGKANCTFFQTKQDVFLSAITAQGARSLPNGNYFFAVIAPGAQNTFLDADETGLLSEDGVADRTFRLANGLVINDQGGTHIEADKRNTTPARNVLQLAPYADTPNNGGVYILAVCLAGATDPSTCKFDQFKVRAGGPPPCVPPDPRCTNTGDGILSGAKWYDANHNGSWDAGEDPIPGWRIEWSNGEESGSMLTLPLTGRYNTPNLAEGLWTVEEVQGPAGWEQTAPPLNGPPLPSSVSVPPGTGTYKVLIGDDDIGGLDFGNVCRVPAANGATLGFWSNKNGNRTLGANWSTVLTNLNLVRNDKKGFSEPFNPSTTTQLNPWLLNATADNMAYMLSVQMAVTQLNRLYGGQANYLVQFDGGWVTIDQLIEDANDLLAVGLDGKHPTLRASGPARSEAEAYKDVFDRLNRNDTTGLGGGVTPPHFSGCPSFAATMQAAS
jgi:hypothetical protein